MGVDVIFIITIIVAIIFLSIAVFQVLLSLGYPLGEFAMGGYFKVLPKKLRMISAVNAIILLLMAFVFLVDSKVIIAYTFLPTNILVWAITIFLGVNSIANLMSQSKKERLVMTPLSTITFLLCLVISLS
ncbi:hypothetical protein [Metabacillus niabensis]|uniref:Membrane protein SirB2 n=1 Tax=Metabacillus niabensis TaxID=324854 RepID=A0ABT9Z556_9BACI|nr:hypothetical protein [Metabacillus niabensis]MDQ0227378.1 putative membrane protein SirB2 [Metabacillus niabensis]PAD69141.1 hypothetical protein CHH83_09905 [Bacillus sp. 7586-K]